MARPAVCRSRWMLPSTVVYSDRRMLYSQVVYTYENMHYLLTLFSDYHKSDCIFVFSAIDYATTWPAKMHVAFHNEVAQRC